MFTEHPVFQAPEDPSTPVWRYMDLPRFISILSKQALFFPSADRLGDPFEGSYPAANVPLRRGWYGPDAQLEHLYSERRRRLRATLVSCWHMNAVESAAMWRLYAREGAGIAVRSTYTALTGCFRIARPVYVGIVRYLRYESDTVGEENLLAPFVHKRASFEYEHELRAVVETMQFLRKGGPPALWPETGEYIPVDVPTLIEGVHIAPASPDWFADVVRVTGDRFGLAAPIVRSQMDGSPVY